MHDILTPPTDSGCSTSSPIFPYRPGPEVNKHSRRACNGKVDAGAAGRTRSHGSGPRPSDRAHHCRPSRQSYAQTAASDTPRVTSAAAQIATRSESIDRFAEFIDEASGRFAVPARWIRAVMKVESGGDAHAISSRGAMGLMQLMPGTWVELSVRHGLGLDPFDPRDNILAGTAYLKEMHDRFGSAGVLAAYHAGPARYEKHLATGQPLPTDTVAYIASVTPLLGNEQAERAVFRIKRAIPWREAPLFVERTEAR